MHSGTGTDDKRAFTVPTPSQMADRLGVSTAAVLIGVLGVAAAAVAGWWALRTPPGPPVEEILPTVDSVSPLVTAPDAMPVDSIVVHVVGAVARPGVHEVSAGSRVVDAVQVAGGLTDDADPARLNLAEPLHDGARVWVPAVGEAQEPNVVGVTPSVSGSAESGGAAQPGGPIDINAADASALQRLPGIGPALSDAIVAYRARAGPFTSVDDLTKVSGIGASKMQRLRELVVVSTP